MVTALLLVLQDIILIFLKINVSSAIPHVTAVMALYLKIVLLVNPILHSNIYFSICVGQFVPKVSMLMILLELVKFVQFSCNVQLV